jgi:putative serine protease PepD
VGDVITKVDDQTITGADSLVATIRSFRPGDSVKVTWQRDGTSQSADMRLDSDG